MADRAPCPCRRLSDGLYAISSDCARHYDRRHPTHLIHCCDLKNVPCSVCDENAVREAWARRRAA